MAHLICSEIASLDSYIEDMKDKFDWAAPGKEVHRFTNDAGVLGTEQLGWQMAWTLDGSET